MKVEVDADCGNAPRKQQVRDWIIAIAGADHEAVGDLLNDDARWECVGSEIRDGRVDALAKLP